MVKKAGLLIIVTIFLMGLSTVSFGGNGYGGGSDAGPLSDSDGACQGAIEQNRYKTGGGSGPVHDILAGEYFDVKGDVITCGLPGNGMEIAIDEENMVVFGVGPMWYWEFSGVDKPAVGDIVSVDGYTVDYNGELRNIAVSIIVDENIVVELRDVETGYPLWRGGRVQYTQ
ncbi:MAG: hypothetical protein JRH15_18105 [Deltaproteobacteria bacterium]|nr:hypothetical protein [Deltaproteobacteria bacterium]